MQGITERDIAYDMLMSSKASARAYCQAALESASPSCFRMFMELHERTQESHRRIWEYLHRRQEYRVQEAHPQEIDGIRQRMAQLRDDHLPGAGHLRGAAVPENRSWEERRREFEPAGSAGRAGAAGFRGSEWSAPGAGYATGAGYGGGAGYGTGAGFGGSFASGAAAGSGFGSGWQRGERGGERPEERRFEPAPRY